MVVKEVANLAIGFTKVVISIILAVLVLSIGLWSFGWVTGIDAIGLLEVNGIATGIVIAGIMIAIAIILGPTIASVKIE